MKNIIHAVVEKYYIHKVVIALKCNSALRYLILNSIHSKAARSLINDTISEEFYRNVFCGGDSHNHFSDVNSEYILDRYSK